MKTKRLVVLRASIANSYSLLEIAKLTDIELIILDGNSQSIGSDIA